MLHPGLLHGPALGVFAPSPATLLWCLGHFVVVVVVIGAPQGINSVHRVAPL